MKKIKAIIKGQIVGVNFRSFVKDKADELGLTGYIKNLDNHTIELVIEGHEAKIASLLEHCQKGPEGSIVEDIKYNTLPFNKEFNRFRIKY